MTHDRRTALAALGLALPFGLRGAAAGPPPGPAPLLRLRSFEEAVREAFRSADAGPPADAYPCRRVEVGYSAAVEAGVQGCHNDRPFAGFPAGHLRIVRMGSAPGPAVGGVRLYVTTVDVAMTGGRAPGRPLDFGSLPPAPALSGVESGPAGSSKSVESTEAGARAAATRVPSPRRGRPS